MNKSVLLFTFFATSLFFLQCTEVSRQKRSLKIRQQQYYAEGQRLYNQHCSSCHQMDGSGLKKLIPPISPKFINKNMNFVICGIKYGIEGPIQIGEITFNNKMPGNEKLSSIEIAEIMTFINNKWCKNDTIVSTGMVNNALSSYKKGH